MENKIKFYCPVCERNFFLEQGDGYIEKSSIPIGTENYERIDICPECYEKNILEKQDIDILVF